VFVAKLPPGRIAKAQLPPRACSAGDTCVDQTFK
jgi:hypothetical protein